VRAADSIGVKLRIEAFPAKGFAAKFRDAVRAGKPPDLVGVDNFGILTGISTPLGDFDGIANTRDSASDLIQIAGSLDSVLVPARGWVYAYKKSKNYSAVTRLALRSPDCDVSGNIPDPPAELSRLTRDTVTAYLQWNGGTLRRLTDPDRLETTPAADRSDWQLSARPIEPGVVGQIQLCGAVVSPGLAFVWARAVERSPHVIGHVPVVVVLRKKAGEWKVLVVSRDPTTNRNFIANVAARGNLFRSGTMFGDPDRRGISPRRSRNSPIRMMPACLS